MKIETSSINWKEWPVKVLAVSLITLAAVFLLFFVVLCFVYFPPKGLDSSLSNLGLYGDYFGGIIGAITSIATLGVTMYLAMVLHRIERENAESAIESQRKVALMQVKLNEFALFNSQCDREMQTLSSTIENHEGTYRTYKSILNACGRITTLFPELDNNDKYIELILFANNLKMLNECGKELNLNMSQGQPSVVIDALLRKMYDHFEAANKEYLKLTKKLSDWTLE